MALVTLDTIIIAGLLMAFVLPALTVLTLTLPAPTNTGGANLTQQLNVTGTYIRTHFMSTYSNLNQTLLGENGSFNANPTIFQAYSFIISNLGTIMTDVIQLPYLDYLSFNLILVGMTTVLPGWPIGFLVIGSNLIYIYMGISVMLIGVSMIMKYSARDG